MDAIYNLAFTNWRWQEKVEKCLMHKDIMYVYNEDTWNYA